MKKLFENFRNYFNEASSDALLCLFVQGSKTNENLFFLYDGKKLLDNIEQIIELEPTPGDRLKFMFDKGISIGMIRSMHPSASIYGQCLDTQQIQRSAVNPIYRGKGYGILMYKIISTASYPRPITGDRSGTSKSAQGVYNKLPAKTKDFDPISDPKTPPKEDDCEVGNDTVNQAFYVDKGELKKIKSEMQTLMANHRTIKEKVGQHIDLEKFLPHAADMLFGASYKEE